MADDAPTLTAQALGVVDLGIQACSAYDRSDLAARLNVTRRGLADPGVHVVVVGEFKQGKSSLVNALINADLCPVDDDVATAVPTFVRHGDEASATLLFEGAQPEDGSPPTPVREPIAMEEVRSYVTEQAIIGSRKLSGVEIRIPRKLLNNGLVIVDTPGVGGLGSAHATATLGALPFADAVLFVSDAAQEFTRTELDFLRQAIGMCPTVMIVMTKIDFYPSWRKIRELNLGHLRRERIEAEIVAVSSPLRVQAVRTNDRELNAESGYTHIVKFINDQVSGGAESTAVRDAMNETRAVLSQMQQSFEAERSALADPESAQRVVAQLTETKERADRLRGLASKWNQTLNDGVADLTSDVDHDFRSRMRQVTAECDEAIEASDPADTWAEFEPWLYARVSHDVVANYAYLRDVARELSSHVAEHFQEGSGEVLDRLEVYNPMHVLSSTSVKADISVEKMTVGKQGFTALRGSYSGVLMFTFLGGMVGAGALLGPIGMGAGLLTGRKSLKEEKERQLKMRQQQAKNAVRRYNDEITFVVSKDSRDTLRRIQRQLRDHYSTRAEELLRSTTKALSQAQEAAKQSTVEREKRLRDLDAEITRLNQLRERADKVSNLLSVQA